MDLYYKVYTLVNTKMFSFHRGGGLLYSDVMQVCKTKCCTLFLCLHFQEDQFGIPGTFESGRIHAAALVVGDYTEDFSHWEASRSLGQWMEEEGIPGISGVHNNITVIMYGSVLGYIDVYQNVCVCVCRY